MPARTLRHRRSRRAASCVRRCDRIPIPRHGTTAHEARPLLLMTNAPALFFAAGRRRTRSRASRHRCRAPFAAHDAVPSHCDGRSQSGKAGPNTGTAPSRTSDHPATSAFNPHTRAASRGLAQPGFNEVAPCVHDPPSEPRDLAETYGLSRAGPRFRETRKPSIGRGFWLPRSLCKLIEGGSHAEASPQRLSGD
jgi:hypothetical protein